VRACSGAPGCPGVEARLMWQGAVRSALTSMLGCMLCVCKTRLLAICCLAVLKTLLGLLCLGSDAHTPKIARLNCAARPGAWCGRSCWRSAAT